MCDICRLPKPELMVPLWLGGGSESAWPSLGTLDIGTESADRRSGVSTSRMLVILQIIIIFQVTGAQGIKKKVRKIRISFRNTLFSILDSFLSPTTL